MSNQAGPASVESEEAIGGGRRTFEEFYERERDGLFGALCLITGNRHDAEELTQDSFLSLWERWDNVAGLESPTGYLYRTAMNAFRKRRRRAMFALRHAFMRGAPRDAFEVVDDRDALRRALAPLTPRQRAALVVTELLGYASEEAGELLGVRAVTVRVLASQARSALAKGMEKSDE